MEAPTAGARPDPYEPHFRTVVKAILDGKIVPFLGAGVNLCGRPPHRQWERGQFLPSGRELADYLAENFGYMEDDRTDLVRVSQYVAVMEGTGPLYNELHALLDADYPPTVLHLFWATLPAVLREKGYTVHYPILITTNYDDVLERAFRDAGEPFDLVTYIAEGDERGQFWHQPPDEEGRLIDKPNEYRGLSPDVRTIIVKIHGAVDRDNPDRDSFVITEDHYIDYLTRSDITSLTPVTLQSRLKNSHFLFMGYSLRDWNLRVLLHRLWGEQKLKYKSWSIQLAPLPIDIQSWRKRDVDILDVTLESYVATLAARLQALPRVGGSA